MPNHIHGIIMIKENNVGAIHAVSHRRAAGVVARTVNCPYINID
jgi:hypothetical protein